MRSRARVRGTRSFRVMDRPILNGSPRDCLDAGPAVGGSSGQADISEALVERPREAQLVPTVLQWSMGGSSVYVTGSFNHWGERIPLRRSGGDHVVCLNLLPGTYQYKFIVDNEWRYASDQVRRTPPHPGTLAHVGLRTSHTLSDALAPSRHSRRCAMRWATSTIASRSRTRPSTCTRIRALGSLATTHPMSTRRLCPTRSRSRRSRRPSHRIWLCYRSTNWHCLTLASHPSPCSRRRLSRSPTSAS